MSSADLRGFIRALPKTETHLHIEGALPYELLHGLDPRRWPERPFFHAPDYRFPDFPTFEKILLDHAVPWFQSADRYFEAASLIFAKHVAEGVRYVETSFHLPMQIFIGVPAREILRAIRAAVPPGLEVRVFAGMLRSSYEGPLQPVIEALAGWDELAGVDLHGFETMPTEAWSAPVWARLRAAGKVTKCHAGEFDGAGRVREAIEQLGVTRVQHGVRAIEDPAVVQLAAERGVTFDVCPISNVRLAVVPSLAAHPLRALLRAGVRCTVSTDDPLVFGNRLSDEYHALADEGGFTAAELAQIARHGFAVADLPPAARAAALAEIDRVLAAFGG